jgi:SAM-dependent methyltransferase
VNDVNIIGRTFVEHLSERAGYLTSLINSITPLNGVSFLDIGGRDGVNTSYLGKNFKDVCCLDTSLPDNPLKDINYVVGDGTNLPFADNTFDAVSSISVIEHVTDQKRFLIESVRVLKPGGILIIQGPNPCFPLDLHTGLPNHFFFPKPIREAMLKATGNRVHITNTFSVSWIAFDRILSPICALLGKRGIIYPDILIPSSIRPFYRTIKSLRLLNICPMGILTIYQKKIN